MLSSLPTTSLSSYLIKKIIMSFLRHTYMHAHTHTHTHMHTHTYTSDFDLFAWQLDLDEGSLSLTAAGIASTDHSQLDCTRFTLVSDR